jgi:hypothetical protein
VIHGEMPVLQKLLKTPFSYFRIGFSLLDRLLNLILFLAAWLWSNLLAGLTWAFRSAIVPPAPKD